MKIAFYKGSGDYIDAMIRWWTKSPYSHSEIVFSDGMWFSASYRDDGVRFKKIEPKDGNWDYVTLDADESAVRSWCQRQHGGYDFVAIMLLVAKVPMIRPDRKRWFCSEICTAALRKVGLVVDCKPAKVTPGQLYSLVKNYEDSEGTAGRAGGN